MNSSRQRILVYEYLSSGGVAGRELPPRWLREGWAMLHALTTDLAALEGVEVTAMLDARLRDRPLAAQRIACIGHADEERRWLCERSADFDGVLLVAPETDGLLFDRCRCVEQAGGRLLGPSSEAVRLAGDKYALNHHLARHAIPVPRSWAIDDLGTLPAGATFPAVLKPRFGAGSDGIVLVNDRLEWDAGWRRHRECLTRLNGDTLLECADAIHCPSVLEEYVSGTHASVAVIAGPKYATALIPCRQILSDDGRFTYLGGRMPLDCNRAVFLAEEVVRLVPGLLGYVGIDFVVTTTEDADDANTVESATVIELNPRLTTSYVALRHLVVGNFADIMLRRIRGKMPRVRLHDQIVEFDPAGKVRFLGERGLADGARQYLKKA